MVLAFDQSLSRLALAAVRPGRRMRAARSSRLRRAGRSKRTARFSPIKRETSSGRVESPHISRCLPSCQIWPKRAREHRHYLPNILIFVTIDVGAQKSTESIKYDQLGFHLKHSLLKGR